jgi:hypothetical protein
MIKRAIELAEAAFPEARDNITAEEVNDASRLNPSRGLIECMPDDHVRAQWEIREIALR